MSTRQRLDVLLLQRGLAPSRARARALIMAGAVLVEGQRADKPGSRYPRDAALKLKSRPRFVSRGGDKLAHALETFGIATAGRICADIGASSGGFTDCLLQGGAARVYAIDVGYGQLAWTLRQNAHVVVMERRNARHIERLPEPVSLVVIDASFISLRLLLPVVRGWLGMPGELVTLVKPQFEAGRADIRRGGVVRDPEVHRRVLHEVLDCARENGYVPHGMTRSPLSGPAGNVEFLAWLGYPDTRGSTDAVHDDESLVASVLRLPYP